MFACRKTSLASGLCSVVVLAVWSAAAGGCARIEPSNTRIWSLDQATLPYAEIDGDAVTIHNIRNCDYKSETNYEVNYYDKKYDLKQIKSVDFLARAVS